MIKVFRMIVNLVSNNVVLQANSDRTGGDCKLIVSLA